MVLPKVNKEQSSKNQIDLSQVDFLINLKLRHSREYDQTVK